MRVVFVNSTHKHGGVKTWTLDVARQLAPDWSSTIIARPGPFLDRAQSLGIEAIPCHFGPDFNPVAIASFLRLFGRIKPDVVVANVGKDLRTAGIAARLLRIPVAHRVGLPEDSRDTLKVRLVHRFTRPRVLAPCEFIRAGCLRALPWLTAREVSVVRTGKLPAPTPPERVNRPLRLVTTSRLSGEKRHEDLLRALSSLAGQGIDFSLRVVGTGPSEAALKELASRLGLANKVEFTGFAADVAAHLRQSDCFVLASGSEGLPNSLLEAMAQGLAVVSRDVGGVAEIWPEELGPYLARGDGPEPLVEPLQKLLTASDEQVLALKRAAWRACVERFNLDRQAALLKDWLADTAQGRW